MWYDIHYEASIQVIKNYKRIISEKEYKNIAKELNLLSPESLKFITGLKFIDLVRTIRNKVA